MSESPRDSDPVAELAELPQVEVPYGLGCDEPQLYWVDQDGDGFGDETVQVWACAELRGSVHPGELDCDDDDASVHPGAWDSCTDGLDADCDGVDPPCLPSSPWVLAGEDAKHSLGKSVALARDGSGSAVAAGNHNHSCVGFVVAGGSEGVLTTADASARVDDLCRAPVLDDLDRDGHTDLIGLTWDEVGVTLWRGPLVGELDRTDGDWAYEGGYLASVAGDVDDSGYPDVWLFAEGSYPHNDFGGGLFLDPGVELGDPAAEIWSEYAYGSKVWSAVTDQDLDGDGVLDLLTWGLEATYWDDHEVWLTVHLGPFSGELRTADAEESARLGDVYEDGFGQLDAGDLDGDGYPEVFFSAPSPSCCDNVVYVFADALEGLEGVETAAAFIEGGAQEADALRAVDVDADGKVDLVLGAPESSDGDGVLLVLYGPLSGRTSLDEAERRLAGQDGEELGYALDAADIDGDGAAEILVGAPRWGTDRLGRAFLLASE